MLKTRSRFNRASNVATCGYHNLIRDIEASLKPQGRLCLPKAASACLMHIDSLSLVRNVIETNRKVYNQAILTERVSLIGNNVKSSAAERAVRGQLCHIVMLWSDQKFGTPLKTPA